MFYLVSNTSDGHRLIGFNEKAESLTPYINKLSKENPAVTAVVYSDKALRGVFLVNGLKIVQEDGFLVRLDDL